MTSATARYGRVKRFVDLALVTVALPAVLGVLLILALAVKVDSKGPVLFRQRRTGLDGRQFWMYKFRTMVEDAEARKQELMHLNELPWPDFKITNDPRVTRVGRALRAASLDELPQLLNVLKGDMSLIGPRPTSFSTDAYQLWHTVRLEVRPGMTGLWQVGARHEATFDERLRLDIAYVRGMSPALDARILAATFRSVIRRAGV